MTQTTLYKTFTSVVESALRALIDEGTLPEDVSFANVSVEPQRETSHGDLAANAAMVLAKPAKANPRALAKAICAKFAEHPAILSAEIAGPGFINLRLDQSAWIDELKAIATLGEDYGRSAMGAGQSVNVEYVSANPTGPMHMGHCRGAVVGDALASLLEFAGHDVIREYYINDAGGQVDTLARSAYLRYREALGEDIGAIPEGFYPGDYLVPVGKALAHEFGDQHVKSNEADWLPVFREQAVA